MIYGWLRHGFTKKMGSNASLERQQRLLPWDPDMEEATEQPPHLILLDPFFLVYHKRRRKRTMSPI
jgi:hypothetical protein